MPEESLLGGSDDPMTLFTLFQDVVAEEFDLDVLVDEEQEDTSEQVTFEEDKQQDKGDSLSEAQRRLYMIDTINLKEMKNMNGKTLIVKDAGKGVTRNNLFKYNKKRSIRPDR